LSPFRRDVQVIFPGSISLAQSAQTVGASIIEGPTNFGVPRAQAWSRAEELMGLVCLRPEALSRYPSEFSGSQCQRISIARALAREPELLIADEAVSALDVSVQAQTLAFAKKFSGPLRSAFSITHGLRVASQICDRVVVMHQGRIVEEGLVSDVFFAPRRDYTRRLLAAAPRPRLFVRSVGRGTVGQHVRVRGATDSKGP
jgi:peptide/nickel transport system ATP-binding protein